MERLIFAIVLVCASCRTSPSPAPANVSATMPKEDETIAATAEVSLPEPSAQDMQRLRTWLAAQETGFDLERLEDCQAQLLVRGDRLLNKSDIIKAADELQDDVRESLALYHWCYYHMLTRLEYQLEQQSLGKTYQDRLQQFLRESKALFILAETLDRSRQSNHYRGTLQKKYIELSQAEFGRRLSPLDPSGRTEPRKSAAPYPDR